ncbi:MAG: FecR domain-containing protein [Pseudomonadota bacterium]
MTSPSSTDTAQLLQEAHEWLLVLDDPDVSDADRERFAMWRDSTPRHRDLYDQAVTFRAALSELSATDICTATQDGAADAVAQPSQAWLRWRPSLPIFGAAVAAALITGIFYPRLGNELDSGAARPTRTETAQTRVGETRDITLGDGSLVTLGPATSINVTYSDSARRVAVEGGAAFFDVVSNPDRPFSVTTEKLTVVVIGTTFDVRSGGGVARVAVAEGQVEVTYPVTIAGRPTAIKDQQTLTAGEMVTATKEAGLQPPAMTSIESVGAWRHGKLIYRGATIAEVLADANRYSARPIVVGAGSDALLEKKVRGVFFGDDVDQLLDTIAAVHQLDVDRSTADRITLSADPNAPRSP